MAYDKRILAMVDKLQEAKTMAWAAEMAARGHFTPVPDQDGDAICTVLNAAITLMDEALALAPRPAEGA